MSEDIETWVVGYDITDDNARARVANLLSAHGMRIQRSVFVLRLPEAYARDLADTMTTIIQERTDAIHLFRLCANCEGQTIEIGQASLPPHQDCWVVL